MLIAALVPRIWGVVNTDVIQRDGVTFINMAQLLASDGLSSTVEKYNQHAGYPALIALAHGALNLPDSLTSWERTGQIISIISGTLATLGLWAFTGLTINWRIAWVSASVFAVGRKWSMLGADVMTDATALCFWIWSIVAVLLVVRRLRERPGLVSPLVIAGVCGLLGGAAYWVRPEGLGAVIVALVVLGVSAIQKRIRWQHAGVTALVCVVCAAALVVPYAMVTGSFTKKDHRRATISVPVSDGWLLAQATAPVLGGEPAATRTAVPPAGPPPRGPATKFGPFSGLLAQTIEALNPAVFGLICIWIVSVAYHLYLPPQKRQPFLKFPHGAGAVAMIAIILLYSAVLLALRLVAGYLDWRHCMTLAFALTPLAGAGLVALFDFLADVIGKGLKVAHPDRFLRNAWVLIFPLILGGIGAGSFRPLHGGNDYVKNAGNLLKRQAGPDDFVVTNLNWVLHYSQMKGKMVPCWNVANSTYLAKLEAMKPRPNFLVLSERYEAVFEPPLHANLPAGRFEKIGVFKQKAVPGETGSEKGGDGVDVVHLFRIHWDRP